VFDSIADAQAQLDVWVHHYNYERPHQSLGGVPPIERFQLAERRDKPATPIAVTGGEDRGPVTTRRVSAKGTIGFATVSYKVGAWLAGQTVEVTCDGGLVQIHHRGVLVATHARRHPVDKQTAGIQRGRKPRPSRPSVSSPSVTRKVDSSGNVSFAGASYRVGNAYRRRQVQVAVVGEPSRSPSASSSSAATRPATTAPENTAHSPTPAADPTASTPPDRFNLSPTYRGHPVARVPGLDRRGILSAAVVSRGHRPVDHAPRWSLPT
jgi:hypothetical protein